MEPAPRAGSEALPGGWAVARLGGRVSPPPPPPQGTAGPAPQVRGPERSRLGRCLHRFLPEGCGPCAPESAPCSGGGGGAAPLGFPPPARPPLSAPRPARSPGSGSRRARPRARSLPAPALPAPSRPGARRGPSPPPRGGHTRPPSQSQAGLGGGPRGWRGSPPHAHPGSPLAPPAAGRVSEERGRSALGPDPPSSPLWGSGRAGHLGALETFSTRKSHLSSPRSFYEEPWARRDC